MKKNLFILVFICTGAFLFAKPVLQLNTTAPGLFSDYYKNCFNTLKTVEINNEFYPLMGVTADCFWEFGADSDRKVKYYGGLETGFESIGIPLSIAGGISWKLKEYNWGVLKLNSSLNAGVWNCILGGFYAYGKASADLVLECSSGNGLYGGIGITDFIMPDINIYKDYGTSVYLMNFAGFRFVVGYKF